MALGSLDTYLQDEEVDFELDDITGIAAKVFEKFRLICSSAIWQN